MTTLAQMVVERGLAPERVAADASARQTLFGSDWVTNLVELDAVDEVRTVAVLSEALGLPPGPAGTLPSPSDGAFALIPASLAKRYQFYPLAAEAGTLTLCVGAPLPRDVVEELEFTLQLRVEQRVVLQLRVLEALRRDYNFKLDYRHTRALAKLLGNPDPDPSAPPPAVFHGGMSMIPRPPSLPEELAEDIERSPAAANRELDLEPGREPPAANWPRDDSEKATAHPAGEQAPSSRGMCEQDPQAVLGGDLDQQPTWAGSPGARRRGPYSLVQALADLYAAPSGTAAFEVFVDFARQFFDYVALFLIHGDFAEGHDARGAGTPRQTVRTLGVSLSLPSALRRAFEAKAPVVVQLEGSGLDAKLRSDLARDQRHVLVVPVLVAGRAVALLYADHDDDAPELGQASDVLTCAQRLGQALELLIVRRKRGSGISPTPPRAADAPVSIPLLRPKRRSNPAPSSRPDTASGEERPAAGQSEAADDATPSSEMRPAVPSVNIDTQSFPRLVEAAVAGIPAAERALVRRPALALLEMARHLAHQHGPDPEPAELERYLVLVRRLPPDAVIPAERLAEETPPVRACFHRLRPGLPSAD